MTPRISILDFGIVGQGQNPSDVLRHVVRTAPLLESLGFEKMWLAEHHERHFCYASPEVVIAAAASVTKHIRVGVAGALMHFHSPLRIAETYRALAALFPDRIDLGLASGLTGDAQIQTALAPGFDAKEAFEKRVYVQRVDELFGYLRNEAVFTNPLYAGPPPLDQPCPPVVMLGSGAGQGNMILAAKHGAAFCYSLAHGATTKGRDIIARYQDTFQPSPQCSQPRVMIAATCLCAKTTLEAYASFGRLVSEVPTLTANVLGDPRQCFDRIYGLLTKYKCDEIALLPMYDNLQQKEDGYRMLSEVGGLTRSLTGSDPDAIPVGGGRLG